MNFKMRKIILLLVTVLAVPLAFADNEKGNGGGIEYCPHPTATQQMYQTYDLKEIQFHLDVKRRREIIPYDGFSTKEFYFSAAVERVRKLNQNLAESILRAQNLFQKLRTDNSQFALEKVSDVNLFKIFKGCEYRQVINWLEPEQVVRLTGKNETTILVDEELYQKLNPLNQAALDFHEAVYAIYRGFELNVDGNSNDVRILTGQAFSRQGIDADLIKRVSYYDEENNNQNAVYMTLGDKCVLGEYSSDKANYPIVTIKNNSNYPMFIDDLTLGDESGPMSYFNYYIKIQAGAQKSFFLREKRLESLYVYQINEFFNRILKLGILGKLNKKINFEITLKACGKTKTVAREITTTEIFSDKKFDFRIVNSPL